jgi:hypothetical protein
MLLHLLFVCVPSHHHYLCVAICVFCAAFRDLLLILLHAVNVCIPAAIHSTAHVEHIIFILFPLTSASFFCALESYVVSVLSQFADGIENCTSKSETE